jgi:hypothetical protein
MVCVGFRARDSSSFRPRFRSWVRFKARVVVIARIRAMVRLRAKVRAKFITNSR